MAIDVGYRLATSDGSVFDFGNLPDCGGLNTAVLPSNVVSMAATPDGTGYWLLLADGSVYAFGNAKWFGDLRGSAWSGGPVPPGAPVVGIAATPTGKGYFVVAADGSVYAFGDAIYRGSRGDLRTDGAVVGMAVDPLTGGYWLVTSRGAVYAEDAPDYGSAAGLQLLSPIVAMAAAPDGSGYWLAAQNGDVYSYGTAKDGSKSHDECLLTGHRHRRQFDGEWLLAGIGGWHGPPVRVQPFICGRARRSSLGTNDRLQPGVVGGTLTLERQVVTGRCCSRPAGGSYTRSPEEVRSSPSKWSGRSRGR